MQRLTLFLTKHSPLLMIASVFIGLAFPPLASAFRPWVVPVSIIMVPLSVLRIDLTKLRVTFLLPGRVSLAVFMILVGLPVAVALITVALGLPPWMVTGLTLIAAAPPLSSAAAFAILLRIDAALVTAISLSATLLAPATIWLITANVPGVGEGMDTRGLILRLGGILGGAFAFALVMRKIFGENRINRAALQIDAVTVLCVVILGIGVMDEIGRTMRAEPVLWSLLFAATWLLSVTSCALTIAVFWWTGRDFALASGVTAAIRNIALMVAAVSTVVEPDVLLVVMTAQLPIFFAPIVLRPIFGRIGQSSRTITKGARHTPLG